MKTSRLKNIIIVILALTDACLLVLLVSRRMQERSAQNRAVTELVSLYAANGITLPASLVPVGGELPVSVEPSRSVEREADFAASLLGVCDTEDVGGGIYRYVGKDGQCLLRSSGSVEAELARDVPDPESFVRRLCPDFGYTVVSSALDAAGSGTVTAVRVLPGATVFNAELSFVFSERRLLSVSGSFVPPVEHETYASGIDSVGALVRFLDYSIESGNVCTAVTGVHSGYLLQSTASVSQHLIPIWCVSTDASRYYVNAISGEVTREA
ncbi:MAG: hypothetical protein IJU66_06850 [Oscillospiraceae bacterium]|nr:hypothetical protein [Oscillospiraceae bacterium]